VGRIAAALTWGALTTYVVVKAPRIATWGGLTSPGELNPPRMTAAPAEPVPLNAAVRKRWRRPVRPRIRATGREGLIKQQIGATAVDRIAESISST
jgi:hypothetical protein